MHQHPRSPPVTASPANSPRTNPARTNNRRDRESESNTTQNLEVGANNLRGLGIEDGAEVFEQDQSTSAPAKEVLAKLNQIVQVSTLIWQETGRVLTPANMSNQLELFHESCIDYPTIQSRPTTRLQ